MRLSVLWSLYCFAACSYYTFHSYFCINEMKLLEMEAPLVTVQILKQ